MKISLSIPLLLMLLVCSHLPVGSGDYYFFQKFVGFLVVTAPICYWLYKRLGILVGVLAGHMVLNTYAMSFFSFNKYIGLEKPIKLELGLGAFQTTSLFVVALTALIMIGKKRDLIKEHIPTITVINSVYVIAGYLFGFGRFTNGSGYSGFLDYSGMNGVLIASCLGFLSNPVMLLVSIIAVILSNSSIATGVMLFVLSAWCLLSREKINMRLIASVVSICVVSLMVFFMFDKHLFDDGNRFKAYELFMSDWWGAKDKTFQFFGAGPGSFGVFGPIVGASKNFMPISDGSGYWRWNWLHSDWLQVMYELGMLGFVLVVGIYIKAVIALYQRKDVRTLTLALGLGAAAIFNYPLQCIPTALLCAYCLVEALDSGHNLATHTKKEDK